VKRPGVTSTRTCTRPRFETVVNIGPDFLATEARGSRHLIGYDTICVQEPLTPTTRLNRM